MENKSLTNGVVKIKCGQKYSRKKLQTMNATAFCRMSRDCMLGSKATSEPLYIDSLYQTTAWV